MGSNKGLTLVELLVVLALSSILMAAMFGSFIGQQKSYAIQDQLVDVQQTLRASIDRMTREIRMAGYGGNILGTFGNVNSFTSLITPVNGSPLDSITILVADEVAKLGQNAAAGSNQIALNISSASDIFNTGNRKYLCLSGKDNYTVQKVSGNTVTLTSPLKEDHLLNESVGLVKAITYRVIPNTTDLIRDENTGAGGQIFAEGVENFQLRYTLASGAVVDSPGNPEEIRMVNVRLTVRTKISSQDYSGDGYLRRTLTSDIEVRNLGL
jgi:prepilin-type N-terminal cleavage/methylation domain-containing protein